MSDNDDVKEGKKKSRRGFASMDKKKLVEIAASGGAAVPANKRSFAQDRELARKAGAKGGKASRGGSRRSRSLGQALQSALKRE
jgi:uncharacterized protein